MEDIKTGAPVARMEMRPPQQDIPLLRWPGECCYEVDRRPGSPTSQLKAMILRRVHVESLRNSACVRHGHQELPIIESAAMIRGWQI